MAIPKVTSVTTTSSSVFFGNGVTLNWNAAENALKYIVEIKRDNGNFTELSQTSGTSLDYTFSNPDENEAVFRVCAENGDERSEYTYSLPVSVIYLEIEETDSGTNYLQPFGLVVDFLNSDIPYVPQARETSQVIAGCDGEVLLDMKYQARVFELDCFMQGDLEYNEREEYAHRTAAYIDILSTGTRYLKYKNKLFRVRRTSSSFEFRPTFINLNIALKCYDVYGYDSTYKSSIGGLCVNSGDRAAYPIIYLFGEYNNPTITVNGKDYQIAIDTLPNDIIQIDCDKRTVKIERNGQIINAIGAWYLEFPQFEIGDNYISGIDAAFWRDRYIII